MKTLNKLLNISTEETVNELLEELRSGNFENVENGLASLRRKFELNSHYLLRHLLTHIMMNIIRWRIQPLKRVRKWLVNIVGLRIELNMMIEENPENIKEYLIVIWDKSYADAIKLASAETGIKNITIPPVTWNEVFDVDFKIQNTGNTDS